MSDQKKCRIGLLLTPRWMTSLVVLALAVTACAAPATKGNGPPTEEPTRPSGEHYRGMDCRALAVAIGSITDWYLDGSDRETDLMTVTRIYAAAAGENWRRAGAREVVEYWANQVFGSEVEGGPVGIMALRAEDIAREFRSRAREECEDSR